MKQLMIPAALAALSCACATPPNAADNGVPAEPVQPGYGVTADSPIYGPAPGVHFGVGVGSWGRHSGAGVGFGLGW